MKNSKKTWGILGTSMGSMLIIVALLTMVGMGSNDTYAACKCPTGYNPTATGCYRETHITGCLNSTCQARTGVPVRKKTGSNCTEDSVGVFSCTIPEYADCEDGDDDKPSSTPDECKKGEYYTGEGTCGICPSGAYCPGDGFAHTCPSNTQKGQSVCGETCPVGEYRAAGDCVTCPQGSYCPGGSDSTRHDCPPDRPKSNAGSSSDSDCKATGGNDNDDGSSCTKANEPCKLNGKNGTCQASGDGFTCKVTTPAGGDDDDDKPNKPTPPSGGDDKPNNPNKPTGGGDGGSGGNGGGNNGGGNSGGNSGGNTGGNNGNNNGGNNTTKNPNTATKAPLVIAIIGIISVGISSVVYFKGKKEINTEI